MTWPAPTHREAGSGRAVHAAQWHRFGERPEGPPGGIETFPFYRFTGPVPPPAVRSFCFDILGYRPGNRERDEKPHAEIEADAFVRNCTTPMREHGWLPHPFAELGTGWILCPGDWLITYEDGIHVAEADHWFAQRYRPI